MKYVLALALLFCPLSFATAQTTGLVGYWTFDEGTGTMAGDSSGTNTGTLLGGASWVPGKVGAGAVSLDGVNGRINAGSGDYLDNLGQFTVTMWVNTASLGTYGNILAIKDSSFNISGWRLLATNRSGFAFYHKFNGGTDLSASSPSNVFSLGTWVHLAVTYDGSEKASGVGFYANGVKLMTNGSDGVGSRISDGSASICIGATCAGMRPSPAIFDEVRVYNRVLTESEIQEIMAVNTSVAPPPPGGSTTNPPPPSTSGPRTLTVKQDSTGNFTTIQACLTAALPGDTCIVSPGRYTETLTFAKEGIGGSPIILKAEFPFSKSDTSRRSIIEGGITLRNYTQIEGFEFVNNAISVAGSYTKVKGNYVHSDGVTQLGIGINILESSPRTIPFYSDVILENNYLYQTQSGIYIRCSNNCLVQNNEIERLFTSPSCRPSGACGGDGDYVRIFGNGITFRNNKLHGSLESEIDADAHIDGIQSFNNGGQGGQGRDTLTNTIFENNFITDFHQGVWWTSGTPGMLSKNVTFRNNIIINTWGSAARMSFGGTYADEVYLYNNILGQGVRVTVQNKATIKNNIFHANFMNTDNDRFTWPQKEFEISNNVFSPAGWLNKTIQSYAILSQTNIFGIDPNTFYVNPSTKDYHFKAGSAPIDAGTSLSSLFTTDFDGVSRPRGNAWDIGPYESSYSRGVQPPPTGTPGDFNNDGVINSLDLSLMSGAWNTNNATYDLNKDGTVNTLDYSIMVQNWTR
jgi:parallel beta-helix repeat protein